MLALSFPKVFRLPKVTIWEGGIFVYFLTLHADQLNCVIGPYTVRFNNLFALLLLLAFSLRFWRRPVLLDRPLSFAAGWVGVALIISMAFSPFRARCFFFFGMYGVSLLCYVLLPYLLVRTHDTTRLISLYLLSFIVVGMYAVFQFFLALCGIQDPFALQKMWSLYRPNALSYEPSFYALYMTPFVALVNGHYLIAKNRPFFFFGLLKVRHLFFVNVLFLVSTATTTFFAYVIFFCVLFCLSFHPTVAQSFPKLKKALLKYLVALSLLTGLFSCLFWDVAKFYFLKFFLFGLDHHSFYERWLGIVDAYKIFLRYPIFGVGLGGVPSYLLEAWIHGDTAFSYFRVSVFDQWHSIYKCFEPSNLFTELLASLGLCGILALFYLMWVYIKRARRAFDTADKEQKGVFFLLFASTLITLVVLQFNQGLFRPYIWVQFTLSYSLMSIKRQKQRI